AGEETEALAGVRDVIERRVNAFGVSEPIVQTSRSGDNWRVLVELPGITDVNAAIKEIGETPTLEFKTEAPEQDLSDDQLGFIQSLNDQTKQTAQAAFDQAKSGSDFAQLVTDNSGENLGYVSRTELNQTVADAAFAANPGDVIGVIENDEGYYVGKVEDKTTGVLDVLNGILTTAPDGAASVEAVKLSLITFQKLPLDASLFGAQYQPTELTGKQLDNAAVQFDQTTAAPVVALTFDSEGADLFEQITSENIGKTIAIYLDGEAISTPVVNQAIVGGEAIIEGDFTVDEAKTLARRLNEGALPVPISLVNQRNIGPSLGIEALERSVFAGLLAMVCLAIFMIGYYRYPGLIAMAALTVYGLLLLAIFKLWPITLTLSGIAGFILSLGMAVDANVLIFERTKEELRRGKDLQSAIDDGFKRAWLSIRDSNVSSLITCVILTWFGTSVIKGFALTLAVGIVLSMFTAISVTRTFLKVLPLKVSKLWVS
ncbi:MAG TPA: protein translocase subunit SecD, partial [Candidatus Kerfeldbacteria bacterium]|nr:protein translocase subunit SecD [Candidatus Kerfeldbacteria bacterium]